MRKRLPKVAMGLNLPIHEMIPSRQSHIALLQVIKLPLLANPKFSEADECFFGKQKIIFTG